MEFVATTAQLIRNAYLTATDDVYENLAVTHFLDGLYESETQQALKVTRSRTLHNALTQALEFEAVKQSVRGLARIHAANVNKHDSFSKTSSRRRWRS